MINAYAHVCMHYHSELSPCMVDNCTHMELKKFILIRDDLQHNFHGSIAAIMVQQFSGTEYHICKSKCVHRR